MAHHLETSASSNVHSSRTERLHALDFLRGLAILGVITVHANQSFPTGIGILDSALNLGRFGVQLFFIISAITMCYMWEKREHENHRVISFYVRRFFRIAPLFWIAIPAYFSRSSLQISDYSLEIILNVVFLNGLLPSAMNSIVPGAWSISNEMVFYAFFPLLATRIGGRRQVYLLLAIAIWSLYAFALKGGISNLLLEAHLTTSAERLHEFLYLVFPNQAPIFLFGCYLYSVLKDGVAPKAREILALILWAAAAVATASISGDRVEAFPVIYMAIGFFAYLIMKHSVTIRLVEPLGRNSYAIYLVHFWVIDGPVTDALSAYLHLGHGMGSFLLAILMATSISYLLSTLTFFFIESRIHVAVNLFLKGWAAKRKWRTVM